MKIIGMAKGNRLIVEMNEVELAQICEGGLVSELRKMEEFRPGREFMIGEKWRRLTDLDTKAKAAANSIPESLRMMAGLIEMAGTSLLQVEEPDEVGE